MALVPRSAIRSPKSARFSCGPTRAADVCVVTQQCGPPGHSKDFEGRCYMLADGCVEVDERSSKADCHPPDIIGGTKLVVNELRCGLMSLWLCAPVSRTVKTRPTRSGHADAQVCAGTASLSCRLTSHLADSRAVRLRHPAPWSFTGLVESANLAGADTMLLFVPGYRIRDPGLRLSFPAHVATDRVDGNCRAHKRPVQLVIMHALLRAAMRAVTRSVQLTRPSR